MSFCRFVCLVPLCWAVAVTASPAADETNAVAYRDVVYLSLDTLAEVLQGKTSLTGQGRGISFDAGGKKWEFANGGDRLKLPGGKEQMLKHPLLVLQGKHFVPLIECAEAFGCGVVREPRLQVRAADRTIDVRTRAIGSEYQRHKVENLKPAHAVVVVKDPVRGFATFHKKENALKLSAGTILVVRRKVLFDGAPHVIVTDCGPGLQSYLVNEKELTDRGKPAKEEGSAWGRYRQWFDLEAAKESALRSGDRKRLKKRVALTIDLCWSLRPYEDKLFQTLKGMAGRKTKVHPALFISGRWLEQHPLEMHDLIRLSLEPNVEMTWGLHSWDHPKSGGFMNDYSPDRLRADTLRLESAYLDWGIVPSVYYRFPGLIHDRIRLREVLELDLFPVDCDSWLALVRQKDREPFYCQVRDGSIILVHGNGNEPAGITALEYWLEDHHDWEFSPLSRFFLPK